MAYILNLTLGCWLKDYPEDTQPFSEYCQDNSLYKTLPELTKHWNRYPNAWPDCIHYPCIAAQFEVYQELPENWNKYVHT